MKRYLLTLSIIVVFMSCDNMVGTQDSSQLPTFYIYNTFNYESLPSFRIGLSNTDEPSKKIMVSESGHCISIKWFHDGRRFLYSCADNDTASLKIVDILDNSISKIWESSTHYVYDASISPDNHTIALAVGENGGDNKRVLAIINSNGSGFKFIHDIKVSNVNFASGNLIFFISDNVIYSISPTGDNLIKISPDTIFSIFDYDVNYEGQHVVYSSTEPTKKLYLTSFDGSETRLLYDSSLDSLSSPRYSILNPKFSPDGTKVLFDRRSTYFTVLNISNLNYTNIKFSKVSSIYNTRWTVNGYGIIFAINEDQLKGIYKIDLSNNQEQKLIEIENFAPPIFEVSEKSWIHNLIKTPANNAM